MRWKMVAAAGVLVLSLAGVLGVACSGSSCRPGTLLLHIALLDDSPLADTITVVGDDPGAAVSQSFPHTPNPAAAAIGVEHITVEVTWPSGYPSFAVVNLVVSALQGSTVLGVDTATVRLGDKCGESDLLLSNRGAVADGGASD